MKIKILIAVLALAAVNAIALFGPTTNTSFTVATNLNDQQWFIVNQANTNKNLSTTNALTFLNAVTPSPMATVTQLVSSTNLLKAALEAAYAAADVAATNAARIYIQNSGFTNSASLSNVLRSSFADISASGVGDVTTAQLNGASNVLWLAKQDSTNAARLITQLELTARTNVTSLATILAGIFDPLGRATEVTNTARLATQLAATFDPLGRATETTNTARLAIQLAGSFDTLGRATEVTNTPRLLIQLGGTTGDGSLVYSNGAFINNATLSNTAFLGASAFNTVIATNFYTGVTNAPVLASDSNGKLIVAATSGSGLVSLSLGASHTNATLLNPTFLAGTNKLNSGSVLQISNTSSSVSTRWVNGSDMLEFYMGSAFANFALNGGNAFQVIVNGFKLPTGAGIPIIKFRDGNSHIITTPDDGNFILTTPALRVSGYIAPTNGVASFASNLLVSASIAVGASPFSWTNNAANTGRTNNIRVTFSGAAITGNISQNGQQEYATTATDLNALLLLQPGEYFTLTYTVGTPTARWKPF